MTTQRRFRHIVTALACLVLACRRPGVEMTVVLEPAAALEAGARFRIDGGRWLASGRTVRLGPTSRQVVIEFAAPAPGAPCPVAPAPVAVRLDAARNRRWVGIYTGPECRRE